jgi:hypothetical protein
MIYVIVEYILKYNIISQSVAAAAQTRFTLLFFLVYLQVSFPKYGEIARVDGP